MTKVKPPFANLQIFNVNAKIMSYLLYADDAEEFLCKLSKNAAEYYENHQAILMEFLCPVPEFSRTLQPYVKIEWQNEWPSEQILREIARTRTKLRCINYKKFCGCVATLQLVFTNEHQSPMFGVGKDWTGCDFEMKSIEIGQNKFIRQIHFLNDDEIDYAVRLVDSNENIFDIGNYADYYRYFKTTTYTIHDGEEIVGLKCKCADDSYKFGFICYKPHH